MLKFILCEAAVFYIINLNNNINKLLFMTVDYTLGRLICCPETILFLSIV